MFPVESRIHELVQRFEEDLRDLRLPGEARGILIAASGGPDSTALCRLFALARDRSLPRTAWPPLWLGHVHHGIRGADADADAGFVRDLAGSLRFRHLEERADAPARMRREGLSPEAAARAERYAAFSRWTSDHPIDVVALAHTADDQAETVLLRILRRAGLRGLAGMPRERPLSGERPGPSPRLVRPLLDWRRREAQSILAELGQPWREDPTNRSPSVPRNRIRHELLPLLRTDYEAAADGALIEIARIAGEAARDLEEIARRAIERAPPRRGPGRLEIDGAALRAIPPSARPFALSALAEALPGKRSGDRLSMRRLAEVVGWLEVQGPGKRTLDLGGGLRAELARGVLTLRSDRPPPPPDDPPAALPLPGSARWQGLEIRTELVELPGIEARAGGGSPPVEIVDRSALAGPLEVRSRRPGDRFRPLGAPGTKKLKEFLRERGVREEMRDRVPLVVDPRGIVWVVGHRIGDPYKLRPGTREGVRLSAIPMRDV